jgi:RHS repeat-associated protein
MFYKASFYRIIILVVLVASNFILQAQQINKPTTAQAGSPTVDPGPTSYPPGTSINFVRTWEAMGKITDPNEIIGANYEDAKQTTQYIDGLGRPLQKVRKQITPGTQPKDMVEPVRLDEFGREVFKYIPYISTDNNGEFRFNPFFEQKTFLQTKYVDEQEQVFYSKTNYEASPLNRVNKTMAAGNNWSGNNTGIGKEYLVNSANDVRFWNINNNPLTYGNNDINTNIPESLGYYNAGELYKNVTEDEVGNKIVEYQDKQGLLILKKVQVGNIAVDYSGHEGFLCTYYVYDIFGNLRFVVPPKAVEMIQGNWQLNDDNIIGELCFRYEYDNRNRMIARKVPGAGWVYMVYDTRDRLVLIQDANMRNNNKNHWLVTLYDELNRPVMTGMMTWSGSPATLQQTVTWQTTSTVTPPGLENNLTLPDDEHPAPANGFSDIWQAGNSITLQPGFESAPGFTAEIVSATNGGPENIILDGIAVNRSPIPVGASFIALTKTFYDNYQFTNTTFTAAYNGSLDAGSNLHHIEVPFQAYGQTKGLVTGSSVRVIENPANLAAGNWLTTVTFYDDQARVIQVNSETHKGRDIITYRYNFSGKVISSYLDHTNPAGTPTSVRVKTNMEYDHAGRLMEVWKTINDDVNKKTRIAKNEYDELGRLKNKKLGLKNDGSGTCVGSFDYSYNIRGWITGINKDFANGGGAVNGVMPWFGMELNYDKGFQTSQYNGNIAGTKWRSRGDDQRRAYGYSYDKANRILGADFSQFNGSSYIDDGVVNFDMKIGDGLNGSDAYDANGNIKSMKQWGLKLTNNNPIDELAYSYYSNSNKLQFVRDAATGGTSATGVGVNLGDFADRNTSGNDYGYDENGNMVSDLNKRLIGVTEMTVTAGGALTYNHLNLPWKIPVKTEGGAEKGAITYTYDATGTKLKKVVVDKSVPGKTISTTTNYVDGLVYESKTTDPVDAGDYVDRLQFVSHDEGRIRYIAAEGATPAHFEYDYFVKDHLGNVRMVLTEEQKTNIYQAGMEEANRNFEVALFGEKINATAVNKPGGFDSEGANAKVSMVNGTTALGRVGPGIILKVMSGDKINAKTFAWYQPTGMDNTTDPGLPAIIDNILGQLAPGIAGSGKGTIAEQVTNSILQPGMQNLLNVQNPASNAPRAYLNWILLDEERFTPVSHGFVPVPPITGTQQKALLETNSGNDIEMTKNGYLYVYVSNESRGNVYFDDIRVAHKQGSLIEETHYYPFGLTMAGISSKALASNDAENKYKYNGIEKEDGLGIEIYDAQLRELDPQVGRWWQIDPKIDKMEMWSPYASNYDNPIRYSDPLGDEGVNCCAGFKEWLSNRVEAEKRGFYLFKKWITGTAKQAGENAKANWVARRDPVHMMIDNPFSMIGGPVGMEANAATRLMNAERQIMSQEARTAAAEVQATVKAEEKVVQQITPIKSLGEARTEVKKWVQLAQNKNRQQLATELENAGFVLKSNSNAPLMVYERNGLRVRLDPPQKGTSNFHMHLEYGGNSYDAVLKPVQRTSPAAHIPILPD